MVRKIGVCLLALALVAVSHAPLSSSHVGNDPPVKPHAVVVIPDVPGWEVYIA